MNCWLRAADYYHALARTWGPDLRTDQIVGAGILWIGGDPATMEDGGWMSSLASIDTYEG